MAHRAFPLVIVVIVVIVVVAGLAGCREDPKDIPVYHRDIAPLFAKQCVSCHQDGGIAPFSLVTYEEAAAFADLAAVATEARIMPPSTVDASGECQTYMDARWLTDDEIKMIGDWAAAGAPEGVKPDVPLEIAAPDTLDDANLFVEMLEEYTPEGNEEFPNDDYRCFFLNGPAEDAYVTGFEILPGQPQEVHHMLLFALLSPGAEEAAETLEAEDAAPGWECFSTPVDEDIFLLAGWAPGTNVMRYPEDTGVFVPGGRRMVMQLHYNLIAGPGLPDVTRLKLRTAPAVAKEAALLPIVDTDMRLPAGQREAPFEFFIPLAGLPEDLEVHGVFPHMHQLGQQLHFELQPLGDTDPEDAFCMATVPQWDFHWQQLFLYEEPVRVTPADVLHVKCMFDTSTQTNDVFWGEGTQDEMCLVFTYVTRLQGGSLFELFEDL